ncbi:MAG: OprO/OprP family phosphate-selective porin [Nannocystaceae bacterium]|nr:OprO/OprP family phosphate-selective porin [Nannocystaceae bacterium]
MTSQDPAPAPAPADAAAPTEPAPRELDEDAPDAVVAQPEPEPMPEPAPQPDPAPTPEPQPAVKAEVEVPAPAATPAPAAHGYVRPPAVAKTDATYRNAVMGAESNVDESKYKIGKGWTVSSKDKRFSLQLRGRIQFRYDMEHPGVSGKDAQQSLQIRRARLVLMGHMFSPHVKYHFQFGFAPRDMQNDLPNENGSIRRNPLRDARIEFDRLRDFTVWMGQMKVPFSRQRVISSAYMNLVDRSIANVEFNLDRDIGIEALSKDLGGLGGRLAYYAGVFMGEGRNAFDLTDFGMLYMGRIEVLPFGKFDDYTEGDLARSKKPGLSIGAAYAFHDDAHIAKGNVGDPPADGGTTDFHHMTADLVFKWYGLSLSSAMHMRRGFNRKNGGKLDDMGAPIATVAARQGVGWYGQLGYLVPKIPLEVVGRYAFNRGIFGTTSLPDADEAGGGLNWYFVGHDLKLQVDYFRLWDETMGTTAADAAKHGTDRVRVQVQVYF